MSSSFEIPDAPADQVREERAATSDAFRHYQVEHLPDGSLWELGRGGMGVTYKAVDVNLHCPVALKIIGPQCFGGENSRRRFIREARLAARIRHPNVAAIYHLDSQEDEVFYAMEFVDGITAENWIKGRGRMSPELALDVVMQVARALTAAARLKLVHRDIKPSNIMLLPDPADGMRVIVKVIDFGLARSMAVEATPTVTTCAFVGTPQFASPEQVENLELDIRSDIYSLGCTFWYLLAGEAPFAGSAARVMAQQLTSAPPFGQIAAIPDSIKTLLRRMLAKDPALRPQNPVALHAEICDCRERLGRRRSALRRSAAASHVARLWATPSTRRVLSWTAPMVLLAGIVWLFLAPHDNAAVAALADATRPVAGAVATASSVAPPTGAAEVPPEAATGNDRENCAAASEVPQDGHPIPPLDPPSPAFETASIPYIHADAQVFTFAPTAADPAATMDLRGSHAVALSLAGVEASEPPDASTSAAFAVPRNRSKHKASGSERRFSPINSLQRARRKIQGAINRIF